MAAAGNTLTIRYGDETRKWLEARTMLTGRSMNAEISAIMSVFFEDDPLTRIRIIEEKGRFIVASAFSRERFRSYGSKVLAETAARKALELLGLPSSAVVFVRDHEAEAA